ncbi:MAG: aldo/keto reductase [Lachnospiraceae bacterium]|nr:aldo/keto reductase [Lachnospiraceae bacterium]
MEKTRKLGQTDIEIAAIGYGCMGQTHSYGVVEPEEDMVSLMQYAHEVGYTFFDSAPIYGEANERYLGKAVAPFRNETVIATKFGIVDESKYRDDDWRADINLFRKEGIDANIGLMELILNFADRKQATPAQIALAWEITKKPYLVPIPGTTKKDRVKENFDAVTVELTGTEMEEIEKALSHMDIVGMGRG